MESAVIVFASTAHALRSERLVKAAGVEARLVPVPRDLSSDCGLALQVWDRLDEVLDLLRQSNILVVGIYPR